MIDIDITGLKQSKLSQAQITTACRQTLVARGVEEGHLAVSFVNEDAIANLNQRFRGLDRPTDVLSFPVDEIEQTAGPRELGDIFICAEQTEDELEAVIHGVLHLCGMDHETDKGEMLARQDTILDSLRSIDRKA